MSPVGLNVFDVKKLLMAVISSINSISQVAAPVRLVIATDNASLKLSDAEAMHAAPAGFDCSYHV